MFGYLSTQYHALFISNLNLFCSAAGGPEIDHSTTTKPALQHAHSAPSDLRYFPSTMQQRIVMFAYVSIYYHTLYTLDLNLFCSAAGGPEIDHSTTTKPALQHAHSAPSDLRYFPSAMQQRIVMFAYVSIHYHTLYMPDLNLFCSATGGPEIVHSTTTASTLQQPQDPQMQASVPSDLRYFPSTMQRRIVIFAYVSIYYHTLYIPDLNLFCSATHRQNV